jgi:hypothetical protein
MEIQVINLNEFHGSDDCEFPDDAGWVFFIDNQAILQLHCFVNDIRPHFPKHTYTLFWKGICRSPHTEIFVSNMLTFLSSLEDTISLVVKDLYDRKRTAIQSKVGVKASHDYFQMVFEESDKIDEHNPCEISIHFCIGTFPKEIALQMFSETSTGAISKDNATLLFEEIQKKIDYLSEKYKN